MFSFFKKKSKQSRSEDIVSDENDKFVARYLGNTPFDSEVLIAFVEELSVQDAAEEYLTVYRDTIKKHLPNFSGLDRIKFLVAGSLAGEVLEKLKQNTGSSIDVRAIHEKICRDNQIDNKYTHPFFDGTKYRRAVKYETEFYYRTDSLGRIWRVQSNLSEILALKK